MRHNPRPVLLVERLTLTSKLSVARLWSSGSRQEGGSYELERRLAGKGIAGKSPSFRGERIDSSTNKHHDEGPAVPKTAKARLASARMTRWPGARSRHRTAHRRRYRRALIPQVLRHTGHTAPQPRPSLPYPHPHLHQRAIMGAAESKNTESQDYIAATYEARTVLIRRLEGSYYNVSGHLHSTRTTMPAPHPLTIHDTRRTSSPSSTATSQPPPRTRWSSKRTSCRFAMGDISMSRMNYGQTSARVSAISKLSPVRPVVCKSIVGILNSAEWCIGPARVHVPEKKRGLPEYDDLRWELRDKELLDLLPPSSPFGILAERRL